MKCLLCVGEECYNSSNNMVYSSIRKLTELCYISLIIKLV